MISYFQNCKIYLCGTKLDLILEKISERAVSQETVENYAKGEITRTLGLQLRQHIRINSSITMFNPSSTKLV